MKNMNIKNFYSHCGTIWFLDDCDSFHDDKCDVCGCSITPFLSKENDEFINHSNFKMFELVLAGNNDTTSELDDLILWVLSDSIDTIKDKLSLYSNIINFENYRCIDNNDEITNYTIGVDFTTFDNDDFIKDTIVEKYECASGQDIYLFSRETSSFHNDFTGTLDCLHFVNDTCYVSVFDMDNNYFDCDFKDF